MRAAALTFEAAAVELELLSPPSLDTIWGKCNDYLRTLESLRLVKTCFPERMPDVKSITLVGLNGEGKCIAEVERAAIYGMSAAIPIYDEYMEMLVDEGDPSEYIHPDTGIGFAYDSDQIEELVRDPTAFGEDTKLALFFKGWWVGVDFLGSEDYLEFWEKLDAHFHYGCEPPPDILFEEPTREGIQVFWDTLNALLEENGLGDFTKVVDFALCDTGTIFDTSQEEIGQGYMELPEFTVEGYQELAKEWEKYSEYISHYEKMVKVAKRKKGVYKKFVRLIKKAKLIANDPALWPKKQPRTLIELFDEGEIDA